MMMGVGFIFMLLVLLVLIGIPLLLLAWITRGQKGTLFRSDPNAGLSVHPPSTRAEIPYIRKCPTCGRGAKKDWNVCPSCGAALS